MDIVTEWKQLVGDIRDAALELFANVEVARTDRGFADEKVVALTTACRPNFEVSRFDRGK
jgi:hypothetical protein